MSEETAARLRAFLEKAKAKHKPPTEAPSAAFPGEDPLVVELVRSFLVWEVGSRSAERAMNALRQHAVDLNELRVFLADEIAGMLGEGDPRVQERAERLRACLNDIYMREHDVRLSHLLEEGKRDTRGYLDTLEGMHPFVSARVVLLCLGGHTFPVDSRLRDALAKAKIVPPDQPPQEVASWIERQVRAGEAVPAYLALEFHADQQAAPKRDGRGSAKGAARVKAASTPRRSSGESASSRSKKPGASKPKPRRSSSENV